MFKTLSLSSVGACALLVPFTLNAGVLAQSSGYATSVIDFDTGSNPAGNSTDASVVLGSPERFTGEGVFPSGVTPFNSPFGNDEILSIGSGGFIELGFDTLITDDASHAFGVDMILFGNAFFVDQSFFDADPNNDGTGILGDDPSVFSSGGIATVQVSEDGVTWHTAAVTPMDLFPTLGFQDYTETTPLSPGSVPTNFFEAMDPSLSLADFAGMTYADLLGVYGSSGGGIGIDISGTGLSSAAFVRIENNSADRFQLDGVSVVPSPGGLALLGGVSLVASRRRRVSQAPPECSA